MITIGNRKIGAGQAPFIIAEMSGNHNHSLERAMEIVEAAAKTGAHALKIQTYTPDTMTLDLLHAVASMYQLDKNIMMVNTNTKEESC